MKKLTLFAFMVMFSVTVFSSNNKSTKDEPIDKEIILKSAIDKKKSFTTVGKEMSLKDLKEHETYLSETSDAKDITEEGAKQTINAENNDPEHQCDGSYTNGISKVDFIKYRSFMRIWLT